MRRVIDWLSGIFGLGGGEVKLDRCQAITKRGTQCRNQAVQVGYSGTPESMAYCMTHVYLRGEDGDD